MCSAFGHRIDARTHQPARNPLIALHSKRNARANMKLSSGMHNGELWAGTPRNLSCQHVGMRNGAKGPDCKGVGMSCNGCAAVVRTCRCQRQRLHRCRSREGPRSGSAFVLHRRDGAPLLVMHTEPSPTVVTKRGFVLSPSQPASLPACPRHGVFGMPGGRAAGCDRRISRETQLPRPPSLLCAGALVGPQRAAAHRSILVPPGWLLPADAVRSRG